MDSNGSENENSHDNSNDCDGCTEKDTPQSLKMKIEEARFNCLNFLIVCLIYSNLWIELEFKNYVWISFDIYFALINLKMVGLIHFAPFGQFGRLGKKLVGLS